MEFKVDGVIKLSEQIFDARFHPCSDNNLIAVATIAGNVHLIESGCVKSKLRNHHKGSSIRKVRFTDDGRMVTIAKTAKVYDFVSKQTTNTLKRDDGKSSTFYSVKSFNHNIMSAGDDDGGVFVWDTRCPELPVFSSYDCEQYISDIDGKYEARKLIVCTSGEGTLTAYDMRAKKMIEPQSELFEAGFQCMKMVDTNKKVVIGGEDGAIYVFNHNEWAHTSGKFAISSDLQNRGKCSIDCMDMIDESSIFLVGCSDGKLRSLTLWPHQILSETILCKRSPLESVHVNPNEGQSQIVVGGENYINIVNFAETGDKDSDGESSEDEMMNTSSEGERTTPTAERTSSDDHGEKPPSDQEEPNRNKLKADTADYLNIFR